jgi:hypothetical protein
LVAVEVEAALVMVMAEALAVEHLKALVVGLLLVKVMLVETQVATVCPQVAVVLVQQVDALMVAMAQMPTRLGVQQHLLVKTSAELIGTLVAVLVHTLTLLVEMVAVVTL